MKHQHCGKHESLLQPPHVGKLDFVHDEGNPPSGNNTLEMIFAITTSVV